MDSAKQVSAGSGALGLRQPAEFSTKLSKETV
jgi:hypothetical protein